MVRADLATKYTQLQQQIEAAAQKAAQGGGAPAAAPIPISQKEKLAAGKGGGKVDPAALEKMEFLEEELNKVSQRFHSPSSGPSHPYPYSCSKHNFGIIEKNIEKNLGATFQACLHENKSLICFALNSMQIWGALFGISGANSP